MVRHYTYRRPFRVSVPALLPRLVVVLYPVVVVAGGRIMSSMAGAGGLAGKGGIAGDGGGLAG